MRMLVALSLVIFSQHVIATNDVIGNQTMCDSYYKEYNDEKEDCKNKIIECEDSSTNDCRRIRSYCPSKVRLLFEQSQLCSEKSRLSAYHPNTVALDCSQGDKHPILEVNYSFRYLFTRPDCFYEENNTNRSDCIRTWPTRNELFFSYTGKFDFYWFDALPSSPVVNRISNPALHFRWNYEPNRDSDTTWLWSDLGFEHRSNGQTTSAYDKDSNGNYIAQQKQNDIAYINGISRGANYFSFEQKFLSEFEKTKFTNWISAKLYVLGGSADSNVTWGDYSDERIWDYDVIRIVTELQPMKRVPLVTAFEYTIGSSGWATDSINLSLTYDYKFSERKIIPFFVKMHFGPMNELSNYTVPQKSIFLGIKLDPYPERNWQ